MVYERPFCDYLPVRRLGLRQIIFLAFRRGILIRSTIDNRRRLEVSVRRRRWSAPFQGVGMPWIATDALSPEQAVKEVGEEDDLRRSQYESAEADELIKTLERFQEVILQGIRVATRLAGGAENVHGEEGEIAGHKA